MWLPSHHLSDHTPRCPQIQRAPVGFVSEQELWGPISGSTDIGDFVTDRFRGFVTVHPRDAEVGDVGGAVGRAEKDVGGFDVAVDDAEGVDVGKTGEEVMEVGFGLFGG